MRNGRRSIRASISRMSIQLTVDWWVQTEPSCRVWFKPPGPSVRKAGTSSVLGRWRAARFRADVLLGNTRMMRVFERAGHQLSVKTSGGIEEVTMLFPDYVADQLLAARAGQGTQPG